MSLHVSNDIIVSNGITGSEEQGPVFILAGKDRSPSLILGSISDSCLIGSFMLTVSTGKANQCSDAYYK